VRLVTYTENEFWIYIHDEGEQFYLHYDYWPYVPPTHLVTREDSFVDTVIRKKLDVSSENCREGVYSYFGTLFHITEIQIFTSLNY
jgi:hypothetical protein